MNLVQSIWSTSDTLGYSALVVTTVIVGLGTYLVVLNIQGLAAICSKHYENHKRRIIERMKSDETWKTLGHRFEQTGLERAKLESPPSDWLLVRYRMSKWWQLLATRGSRLSPSKQVVRPELPVRS